jgi:uncharacterized protein with PQ loop repeat
MDNLDKKQAGFISYVFSMNEDQKIDFMNLLQYGMLSLVPVLLLNKLVQAFVPEASEEKSSIELLVEILLQLSVMLVGIYYIHRIISYIPTYSGEDYGQVNLINMVLAFLVIVMSLQTKLGEKGEILYQRVLDLWYGDDNSANGKNRKHKKGASTSNGSVGGSPQSSQPVVRISQPLSAPMSQPQQPVLYDPLNRTMLPPHTQNNVGVPSYDSPQTHYETPMTASMPSQPQQPNFDMMYQEPMEPMAANAGGFGGAFSAF